MNTPSEIAAKRGKTVDETISPAHPAHTPQLHDEPAEAADTASVIA